MTRYRYYTATTVDGFLADENDSLAWLFKQDTAQGGDVDPVVAPITWTPTCATNGSVMLGSGRRLFGGAVDLSLRTSSRSGDFLTATFDVVGPLDSR